MSTLFLGSTGFVGKTLLAALEDKGEITIFSREINKNLPPSIRQVTGNYSNEESLTELRKMKFERVIDCSWNGLPNLTDTFNLENLEIKLKLLRIFADIGVTEINSFGSCLEYGNLNGEVTEESAGREISNFGLTKLRILEALENSGIRFRWFRPFYLIGAQQHRNSLIHAAIETMSKGFDFVPREPSLMFDFISINDAIKGVVAALNNQDCLGVINLGSSQETSVNEIVNLVRDYFGFDRTEVNGISGMIANCDKLKSMTGWRLEESMPEAVNRILKTKGIG